MRSARQIELSFNEQVSLADAEARFVSGPAIDSMALAAGQTTVLVTLVEPLAEPADLTLRGVKDRAQRPNEMAEYRQTFYPDVWPSQKEGLVLLWESAKASNLVKAPDTGRLRSYRLNAKAGATLNRHHGMQLRGGYFEATWEASAVLNESIKNSNELTLEVTLEPSVPLQSNARIVTQLARKAPEFCASASR